MTPATPVAPASTRIGEALRAGLLAALACLAAGLLGLHHLLGLPLLPLVPVALLTGTALGLTRLARIVDLAAAFLLGLVLLVAFTPLIRWAAPARIAVDPIPAAGADAVVVLSAALSRDELLSPAGADRLLEGIELLHGGAAMTLVTSRIHHSAGRREITSDADQARLVALAPDSIRWEIIDSVSTTRDEAVRAAALAERLGWRRVVVVTSPLHTRRACAAFRQTGLAVICAAAPSRDIAIGSLATAGDRVAAFGPWLYEVVGWWWYRSKGWVGSEK